jgi:RHS repeat-associated protein
MDVYQSALSGDAGNHAYDYDPLYRLTNVNYPTGTDLSYSYDGNGNRLTANTDDYTYDVADQLQLIEALAFDYDENGNQTDKGSDTFTYDYENRLTESVVSSVTSTSTYNGDGLRMSLEVDDGSPTTTDYQWDTNRSLPVILNDGTNRYVYGLDLISAIDGSNNVKYFMYDGLGSTTEIVNDVGTVSAAYSYDVFGTVRAQSAAPSNPWLFTGEQRDADSGLYYLRARYYDSTTGRFLSRDPVIAAQPYEYAGNGPVNFTDRSGLCFGLGNCGPIDDVDNVLEEAYRAGDDAAHVACVGSTVVACGLAGLGPLGDSYFDLNFTIGCLGGVTVGLQYKASQGLYGYAGSGASSCYNLGASLSVAPTYDITPGLNCAGQVGWNFPTPWVVPTGPTGSFGVAPAGDNVMDGEKRLSDRLFEEIGVGVGLSGGSLFAGCTNVRPIMPW